MFTMKTLLINNAMINKCCLMELINEDNFPITVMDIIGLINYLLILYLSILMG